MAPEGIAHSRARRRTASAPVPVPETVAAVMGGASTSTGVARRSAPAAAKAVPPTPRRSKKLSVTVAGAAQASKRSPAKTPKRVSSKRSSAKRAAGSLVSAAEDSQVTHAADVSADVVVCKQAGYHVAVPSAAGGGAMHALMLDSSDEGILLGGAYHTCSLSPGGARWCFVVCLIVCSLGSWYVANTFVLPHLWIPI